MILCLNYSLSYVRMLFLVLDSPLKILGNLNFVIITTHGTSLLYNPNYDLKAIMASGFIMSMFSLNRAIFKQT